MTQEQNKLVEDNLNLVYWVMNKYYPTIIGSPDREDFYQIGCLGLIHAALHYEDYSDRIQFSTYAVKAIHSKIRNEFVRRYRQKCSLMQEVPIESQIESDDRTLMDMIPDDRYRPDHGWYDDLKSFANTLTDLQRKTFYGMLDGKTTVQMAKEEGCTTQCIIQRVDRIRYYFAQFYQLAGYYQGRLEFATSKKGRPKKNDILKIQFLDLCPTTVSISILPCETGLEIRFDEGDRHAVYFASPQEKQELYKSEESRKIFTTNVLRELRKEK